MSNIHVRKPDRILSERFQVELSKTYSFIQHGLIGAFLFYTIFKIVNMFADDKYVYLGDTNIDAGFVWIIAGALVGVVIRRLISINNLY